MQQRFYKPSPAETAGIVALLLALLLALFSPLLTIIPLLLFLISCLAAPFFVGYGFFLPVISRGSSESNHVALTFDDGPWPASTPILLDLLARHKLVATFFVVGRQAAIHPDLIAAILAQGHSIGNHSLRHDAFLMLRMTKTLQKDIHTTQEILIKQGIRPLVFRPPSGIAGPRLKQVLAKEKLLAVNYSCRAMDGGNRNIDNLAEKILQRLRPGDIIMLHDLPPQLKSSISIWQRELDCLFAALQENGQVVSLEKIIHHPVWRHCRDSDSLCN